jgi:hypothetical protein
MELFFILTRFMVQSVLSSLAKAGRGLDALLDKVEHDVMQERIELIHGIQ